MFEIIEKEEESGTIIKVFGVGGAGGNARETDDSAAARWKKP